VISYIFPPQVFPEYHKKGNIQNWVPDYLEKYKSRILYGSDYPNLITPREDEIENLLKMDLSQEFYDKIFYYNGIALIHSLTGKIN
jgi:predicted TIM-barrel fold metal-dependent hydrolase